MKCYERRIATTDIPAVKVLIVDDDPDLTELTGMSLEARGHEVALAYDARDALALCAASSFDVVLLDIRMPGPSGFEVVKRLRELPSPPASVIAVTGTVMTVDEARAAGFTALIAKPVDPELLLRSIEGASRPPAGAA